MIEITVRPDHVTVNGHARHGPPGEDIVCAAVSALTQTLEESLRALTADPVNTVEENGYISIWYRNLSESGKLLVDSFFIGICGIADSYPECIKIL